MVRGGNAGQWADCPGRPTHAAVWREQRHPSRRWRVFLCKQHASYVAGARRITEADRVALEVRQRRREAAARGEPWVPPRPLRD